MADPVRIAAIKVELETGGAGATPAITYQAPNAGVESDAVIDAALMSVVDRTVDRVTMSGSEIFEAIDDDEWGTVSTIDKDDVKFVVSLGDNIQVATGTKARAMLVRALAGKTLSIAALVAISTKTVSRAEELGFGRVTVGDIQSARVS